MAYVVPNSTVYLLKNVPLDVEHKHTWYFTDYSTQFSHFIHNYWTDETLAVYDSQYIRYEEDSIKLPFPMKKCIDCNYMVFGNSSFEERWFYAFITNVEYVSNDVTRIYYEIDELQTWMCFFTLEQCFIERQHQVTDVVGDNLIPEGLETGEYLTTYEQKPAKLDTKCVIVASTLDSAGNPVSGQVYNNTYSAVTYTFGAVNDQSEINRINTLIQTLQASGNTDAIVAVFMGPHFLFETPNMFYVDIPRPNNLNGYYPRNKKLLTDPYIFCYVSNMQGIAAKFPFEYFSTQNAQFTVDGAIGCSPQLETHPRYYKGLTDNYDECMLVGGFPQCTCSTDSFKAWVAQQVGPIASAAISVFADSAGLSSELGVGGYENTATYTQNQSPFVKFWRGVANDYRTIKSKSTSPGWSLLGNSTSTPPTNSNGTIWQYLKSVVQRYIKPPQCVGGSNATALYNTGNIGFTYYIKSITNQFAQIIDGYFDMFGYAIHRNATPNIHARKGWTYVKTQNCVVNGNLPASSARFIEDCFNAGVTFWNPDYTIGDYTQDNSPGGI